jgi:hypothetical protein
MIAKIHKAVLTDKSEVYDILLEESGVTLASIPCTSENNARYLLAAISIYSNVKVIR